MSHPFNRHLVACRVPVMVQVGSGDSCLNKTDVSCAVKEILVGGK